MAFGKHRVRFNNPGDAHALTFSCFQRQPFLDRDRSRDWLITALDNARVKHRYHIWAYVIMPEHAHVLVWPTEPEYELGDFLSSVKQSVAKKALVFVRRHAPAFLASMADREPDGSVTYRFWQRGGGYDRNVDEPIAAHAQIDYMHCNPVRRGLCVRAEDYTYSSAGDYAGIRVGPLRVDRESVPRLSVR
jgi:putative transposase